MCGEYYEDDPPHLLKRYIAERDLKIDFLTQAVQNRDTTIVQLLRVGEQMRQQAVEHENDAFTLRIEADFPDSDDDNSEKQISDLEEENQNLSVALGDAESTISDLRDEIEALERAAAKPAKKKAKGRRK